MDKFPRTLKELREEKGLTQVELAKKLNFKNGTVISNWETGERKPDIENLLLLSRFFGVTLDHLVGNQN